LGFTGINHLRSEEIFRKKFGAKSAVARGGVLGTLTLETRPGTADFTSQFDRLVSPKMQPANLLAAQPERPGIAAQERRWKENGERSERQ